MTLQALFVQVLNMSLTAGVVITIVLVMRLLLKNAPKKFSYALWAVVLFRLLCPFSLPSPMSLFHVLEAPAVSSGGLITSVEYLPSDVMLAEPETPVLSDTLGDGTAPTQQQTVTAPTATQPNTVTAPTEKRFQPMQFAAMMWLFGGAMMLLFGGITYLHYRRNLIGALRVRDNIYLADHIGTPFVTGLIRPKIYLPSAITSRELPYILAHEQYHIRRLDHITKLIAYMALCIHWFNPLAWVAFILSSKDMEMSCDEAVLSKLGGNIRADYSQSLLNLALGHRIYAAAPLAFGENDTKGRVLNMAKWKKPTRMVSAVCLVLCLTVLAACALNPSQPPISDGDTADGALTGAADSNQTNNDTIVGKWVMEDGGLVINYGTTYDIYYTFRADGTGEIFDNIPTDTQQRTISRAFTYTLGEPGHLTITMEDANTDYTYSIRENTLLLDSVRYGEMNLTRVESTDVSSTVPDDTVDMFLSEDGSVTIRWRVDDPGEIADVPVLTGTLHDMTSTDAKNAAAAFFSDDAKFWQAPQGMENFQLEDDLTKAVPTNWRLTDNYVSPEEHITDLNMIVSDRDISYAYSVGYSSKNYGAINDQLLAQGQPASDSNVYGGSFRNSNLFIYSDDDSQLIATEAPTTEQLQAALNTAAEMLTELNMGSWQIVNYFVRSDPNGKNEAYNIGVVAAPMYEGVSSTLDVLSKIEENSNCHATLAYILFDTDCDVRTAWLYSPMNITGKLDNASVMTTEQVMKIAKTYLTEEGYYKFKHLPNTDGTVIAEITNAEICYRREYGSDETKPFSYEYVPYILFYGNGGEPSISPSFDYANVYPNADAGNVPLFAVNAIDGSILQAGFNHIII